MFSYGLILLAQLACLIHCGRTGRSYYWFFVILFIPILGILGYLIIEIAPGLLRGRSAMRLSRSLNASLDPTRRYRELARSVEMVPSVANLRALADECLLLGRNDEASERYRQAQIGMHAAEPGILLGLAKAELRKGDVAAARLSLERLTAANPAFRSHESELLAALILEAERREAEAIVAYERLLTIFPGEEVKARLALLLAKVGRAEEARALFSEIRRSVECGPAFYRRAQQEWYALAKRYA